ncbi:MAG TPA: hypothetical protein VFC56_12265 [Stellaceae bacterium]|nr:hypothetical protein [Stellaceae bacterium]
MRRRRMFFRMRLRRRVNLRWMRRRNGLRRFGRMRRRNGMRRFGRMRRLAGMRRLGWMRRRNGVLCFGWVRSLGRLRRSRAGLGRLGRM